MCTVGNASEDVQSAFSHQIPNKPPLHSHLGSGDCCWLGLLPCLLFCQVNRNPTVAANFGHLLQRLPTQRKQPSFRRLSPEDASQQSRTPVCHHLLPTPSVSAGYYPQRRCMQTSKTSSQGASCVFLSTAWLSVCLCRSRSPPLASPPSSLEDVQFTRPQQTWSECHLAQTAHF